MTEIIQQLNEIDTQIFLFFNGCHNSYWDGFMYMFTNAKTWIPLYISFLYVMIRNYQPKAILTTLAAIALLVLLCDQTASGLLKPMVGRLRPSNEDNPLSPMVHIVQGYRGGKYGFPSSHASNTWGISLLAIYLVRRKLLTYLLLVWTLLTCYTRMYLGVHYFGDILVGSLIGIIYATVVYLVYRRYFPQYEEAYSHKHPIVYGYLPLAVGLATVAAILCASGIMLAA